MAETTDLLVVKNVEEQLLSEKKSKRQPGEVVYPLEYSNDMVDLYAPFSLMFSSLF
jgi:hypothetical protein